MLTILTLLAFVCIHIGLFIYCQVRHEFAPQFTEAGEKFDKTDWEMFSVVALIVGLVVPVFWTIRWMFITFTDVLKGLSTFFVKRIKQKIERKAEEERRLQEEKDSKAAPESYSYRRSWADYASEYKKGMKEATK